MNERKYLRATLVTHTYVDLLQGRFMAVLHHVNQGQCALYCQRIVCQLNEHTT